jgi:hypothetical protein
MRTSLRLGGREVPKLETDSTVLGLDVSDDPLGNLAAFAVTLVGSAARRQNFSAAHDYFLGGPKSSLAPEQSGRGLSLTLSIRYRLSPRSRTEK